MCEKTVRILVVYDSWTGNVEKMAHAVAEGVKEAGAEVKVVKVDEVDVEEVPEYDGYAFGSPTHCGTMSYKMNQFFNERMIKFWGKLRYKVAVAFASSGGLGGGNEMTLWSLVSTILNFGMMTFGVPDYVAPGVTLHYGAVAIGTPDSNTLKACKLLGRRLVEHVKVVKAGLQSSGPA
ncbi:MAG: flavodoxin domain-containing protein [Thermofilaceae archaeon]|nr:flavodoxin domain-containing protein [Thermofilaceae archaeon]MCX8180043.1 flavodoxin domain-containing protein [Thermofilaceae archaeon]